MIGKTTIAAALISLSALAAVPAQGRRLQHPTRLRRSRLERPRPRHGHHMRRHRLSTDEVRWILRDRGYRQIRFFDNHGAVYQLRARKHGDTFFLVVSARTGEILSRNRI